MKIFLIFLNSIITAKSIFAVIADCGAVNTLLGKDSNYDCCTHNGIKCINGRVFSI